MHDGLAAPLVVKTQGLSREFGGKPAVLPLDLEVRAGEFFGFLGPNGAGKSTTLRMLCGLLKPTSGSAQVLGLDCTRETMELRRRIGVLPEEPALYERLTPREMLALVARLHGLVPDEGRRRTEALFELMELAQADRSRLLMDFSMGMRKKVALAAALLHGPKLLFLDEPFNGIDAVTVRAIRGVLTDAVNRGVTVFFSSHVLELVEKLCTRIAIITEGRLRVCGTLTEVRMQSGLGEQASLEDVFVHLAGGTRTAHNGVDFL
ncbi:MAG: ABC transporter ATP-binding protein [Planctomycetes bacterium]|nr:ABC transporter ATP-binding protein [Planctomycetota bacterium]